MNYVLASRDHAMVRAAILVVRHPAFTVRVRPVSVLGGGRPLPDGPSPPIA